MMLRYRFVIAALCVSIVGCSESHGARPIVMCGATLSPGGLSAPLILDEVPTDSPQTGTPTLTADTGTLIEVSQSCARGAAVAFSPAAVTLGPVAYAKDGKLVMFGVSPKSAPRDVVMTVTSHGHTRTVRLSVLGSRSSRGTDTPTNSPGGIP